MLELHHKHKIAVIGLGYVGLPLAIEFGKKYDVIGFDISESRIAALQAGYDSTLEVSDAELLEAKGLHYSSNAHDLKKATVFIVTVPTPIDASKRPDLTPLLRASETVGAALKRGDTVIYESTVYPGATEEECVPVLERVSGLTFNTDFVCGYSPERINPGDRKHRLPAIVKVTSGSTDEAAKFVDNLYSSIIKAGTHMAPSIKVAEAAKVIENTQRDVNIALMNELSIIFNKMKIDTDAVLEAAETKWNFLPFRPGLVGGHCIGVDPYYLTYKAECLGHHPEVILSGRRINDSMGSHVAKQFVKYLVKKKIPIVGAKVLIMGLTFKENCPDLRNTRVIDIVNELSEWGVSIDVMDPIADPREAMVEYGVKLIDPFSRPKYDGIIIAVAHQQFVEGGHELVASLCHDRHIIYDLKHILAREQRDIAL